MYALPITPTSTTADDTTDNNYCEYYDNIGDVEMELVSLGQNYGYYGHYDYYGYYDYCE